LIAAAYPPRCCWLKANPKLTVEEVRSFYSRQYPDLANAAITGPKAVCEKLRYTLVRAIGTKG
jgi:PRTRC genetic system protein C